MPTEEEGRKARIQAERGLRETTDRWKDIHDVSEGLEQARRKSGPDPFLEELAQAMRPKPKHHREA